MAPQNLTYLFAACAIIWVVLFGYSYFISQQISDLRRQVSALRRELPAARLGEPDPSGTSGFNAARSNEPTHPTDVRPDAPTNERERPLDLTGRG